MSYMILSIAAALLWSVVNVVDKYVVSKYISDPWIPVIFIGIIGAIFSGLIILFTGFPNSSVQINLIAVGSGAFYLFAALFYVKAIMLDDVSKLMPIFAITPILILPFSIFLFYETYSTVNLIGILFLVIGAITITLNENFEIKFNKALFYVFLSLLCGPVVYISNKYLLTYMSFEHLCALTRVGFFLCILPLMYLKKDELLEIEKTFSIKPFVFMSLNQVINMVGILISMLAIQIGKITIVSALLSFQYFFVLILCLILRFYFPKIQLEKLPKRLVFLRSISILILILGTYLVSAS